MRGLHAHGFGKIHASAELHENDDGNTFMQMIVEFEDRMIQKSGKLYQQRILFRSFDPLDVDQVGNLTAGKFVVIDGLVDAVAEKSSAGWWYANPRVTGRVHQIVNVDPHD
jgi:hypothetical protein